VVALGSSSNNTGSGMSPATRRRRRDELETLPAVERRLLSTCSAAAAAEAASSSLVDVRADHPAIAPRRAAVLVALFEAPAAARAGQRAAAAPAVPHVWLTRRADHLNAHAGEVCLPGGKRDPGDADDAACALREAEEELGLPPASARVVCALPPLLSKHRLSVHPVVAVVRPDFAPKPNPEEVAEAFSMPLSAFLERENHLHYDFYGDAGATTSGPSSGSGEDGDEQRRRGAPAAAAPPKPKLRMHSFSWGDHVVWGLTAEILVRVARLSLGREAAFPLLAAPSRRRGGDNGGGTDYALLWAPDGKRARVGGGPSSGRWERLLEQAQGGG
jgi:8-oxo-dGTP pyrophosphatase MutT (NUDIX family)